MFRYRTSRSGITVTETVVATMLLMVALGATLRFAVSVNAGLRNQELRTQLDWELLNARERIGSWKPEDIRSDKIAELPISVPLQERIQNAKWSAELSSIEEPISAIQVDLKLQCEIGGQSAEPCRLSFWVPKDSPASNEPEVDAVQEKKETQEQNESVGASYKATDSAAADSDRTDAAEKEAVDG